MRMNQKNALLLIPCCKRKKVIPIIGRVAHPLPNVQSLRNQLLHYIKQTPDLANKLENQRGILNSKAPLTKAIDLYIGNFYQAADRSLHNILAGQYPSIHLFIVSAFYGLVKLDEGLKEYELKMGDRLHNGMKMYQFWQHNQLWQLLQNYITQNNISHVWSLLPDSLPSFPYHRVFKDLWRTLKTTQIQCCHVQVLGAGAGIGYKRAEWLVEILNTNPNFLLGCAFQPKKLMGIPGYVFIYVAC